jgi:D-alanyl-D-alanine carboxypeptidase
MEVMVRAGFRAAAAMAAMGLGACAAMTAYANPVLLFEPETGSVLHAEEPDRAWHPASVTKLMTAYLTFEAVKSGALAWDADVPLSEHARSQPATRIGLRSGISLNVEQAVRGLVLRSANDFATALAERIGGTEEKFVETMNATAKRLGMTRTVFRNPHGLPDPDQVTTARDLAILTTALLKDFPDRAEVFSTPTVRIHKGTFHSQNDLLRTLPGADGMKTGFTCASGYNVVASATRDGHRLIAIVLGAVNREKRSQQATELLEAGFAHLSGTATQPGDPALSRETNALNVAPVEAVHAKAHPPITITPVALNALAVEPTEAVARAEDIARKLRSGKCRGYGGFAKKDAEPATHEPEADEDPSHVVAHSIAPPAKPPAAHAAALAPKKAVAMKPAVPAKAAAPPQKPVTEPKKVVAQKAITPKPVEQKAVAQKAVAQKAPAPKRPQTAKPAPVTPEQPQGDGN